MRTAAVYVTVVAAIAWGAWRHDQANAQRVETIDRALITCRANPPQVVHRPSFPD